MNIKESLKRLFGKRPGIGADERRPSPLPMQTVTHDSVDTMRFKIHSSRLARLERIIKVGAPVIAPDAPEPEPLDFSVASPEELAKWQEDVRKAREAAQHAKPYELWPNLVQDLWYAYHHTRPPDVMSEGFDPRVELHKRIMSKVMALEDFVDTRALTRDDATMSAAAVIHGAEAHLKPLLETDLVEQVRQAQEAAEQINQAQEAEQELGGLRTEAGELMADGQPIPDDLRDKIKALVKVKRGSMDKAAEIMAEQIPMSKAAADRIQAMATSAKQAAEEHGNSPHFGQGFGEDEPVYESPEQALAIAERWSKEPLKSIAQAYGRVDPDMRFERAKRIVGGQEEIVDIEFSDNIKRVTFGELARVATQDEDFFDDFLSRYLTGDLLTFQTVGEEHAGRGAIGMVLDESGSTKGDRNMFSKSTTLAVLNMARRDKRDMFVVAFSSQGSVSSWMFKASEPLDAEQILDMAAHFYGGGTSPLQGIELAERIINNGPTFKKADIVLVTDGECPFRDSDKHCRERLIAEGVRLHGIGIGRAWGYLQSWVSDEKLLAHVMDFELGSPNEATTQLATHIS